VAARRPAESLDGPGRYFLVRFAGVNVIVLRDEAGGIAAFHNTCRHRGTLLCREDSGRVAGSIQCPYHAWTYGLDGSLKSAPLMEKVVGFRPEDHGLGRVATAVWDGHVFVNLAARPQPFAEHLAGLDRKFAPWAMGELRSAERRVYHLKTNWKLVVQNYSECLHCPIVHPLLNQQSHYMSGDNEAPQPTYLGGSMELRDGVKTLSLDGQTRREPLPGLSETERRCVYYYALLPNLLLNLHPDYMLTFQIWPLAVDRTDVVCEWHFHPGAIADPASIRRTPSSSGTSRTARTGSSPSGPTKASQHSAIAPGPTRTARNCSSASIASCSNDSRERTAHEPSPLASLLAAALLVAPGVLAHPRPKLATPQQAAPTPPPPGTVEPGAKGVTGQGALRFRVLMTGAQLPEAARKVVVSAHGGFAVDRREGKGETYFALPGAGVLRLSADFKQVTEIATAPEMKDTNLHNTAIWYGRDGTPMLSFPANDSGASSRPRSRASSEHARRPRRRRRPRDAGRARLLRGRRRARSDGRRLPRRLAVRHHGYSSLDFVLTARVASERPLKTVWNDLAFAGRGTGPGQLGTGHGITVPPGTKRIDVADRANAEIDRYTRYGQYLETLRTPAGSLPCDIDYLGRYAVVGALDGPDRSKGAPIYLYEDDRLVSTLFPKDDLGLANFKHVHNAVLRQWNGKLYVIAQAWNPGDFAVLEQVLP
jgi:Rieske 2Fe-2S family protein